MGGRRAGRRRGRRRPDRGVRRRDLAMGVRHGPGSLQRGRDVRRDADARVALHLDEPARSRNGAAHGRGRPRGRGRQPAADGARDRGRRRGAARGLRGRAVPVRDRRGRSGPDAADDRRRAARRARRCGARLCDVRGPAADSVEAPVLRHQRADRAARRGHGEPVRRLPAGGRARAVVGRCGLGHVVAAQGNEHRRQGAAYADRLYRAPGGDPDRRVRRDAGGDPRAGTVRRPAAGDGEAAARRGVSVSGFPGSNETRGVMDAPFSCAVRDAPARPC
ncbi:hypothetical protein F01_420803 [Burkholderia cenocepacia]|nr:hypothetical protein F01_420803 [Burkholderia cenocepacia]